jgi:uncharacterized DUF497 family protein
MTFEWDDHKAAMNLRKHGVSFEEARTVFGPQRPVIAEDWDHSDAEDRYYAIGVSERNRILTVCFAYRNAMIRIVIARRATRNEAAIYEKEIKNRSQGA